MADSCSRTYSTGPGDGKIWYRRIYSERDDGESTNTSRSAINGRSCSRVRKISRPDDPSQRERRQTRRSGQRDGAHEPRYWMRFTTDRLVIFIGAQIERVERGKRGASSEA